MSEILDARAPLIDWAARSLVYELSAICDRILTSDVEERAEALVAIAEHYRVPDDVLICWIHATADGKEWSAAEFRAWCEQFQKDKFDG